MTNVVAPRALFGVIVPSTNTVVEHDYWRAGIEGVAYRAGSMHIADPSMAGDAGFEAIVQVGTNLSFVGLADTLEAELGKPVVAINAATLWHALRQHDIADRVEDCGVMLREH